MYSRVVSILILSFMAVTCILFFFVSLTIWFITILFDRRLYLLHMFTSFWASLYIWIVPAWKVTVKGREKIDTSKTYVIVSNHQSQLDILVSFSLFFPFKWVSKAEVFKVPFMGWNMVLNRYIKLVRGDLKGVKNMLKSCEKALKSGISIFIFPEGTRSPDGNIGKFSNGAFALAKKLDLPILLVGISGTSNALPKNSLNFHGTHNIKLEVIDEVSPDIYHEKSVSEIAEYARSIISTSIESIDSVN